MLNSLKVLYDSEAWCATFWFLDRSTPELRSVLKTQNGDQSCSSNRKSMKFLRAATG